MPVSRRKSLVFVALMTDPSRKPITLHQGWQELAHTPAAARHFCLVSVTEVTGFSPGTRLTLRQVEHLTSYEAAGDQDCSLI